VLRGVVMSLARSTWHYTAKCISSMVFSANMSLCLPPLLLHLLC
jgi:hypothetical protein